MGTRRSATALDGGYAHGTNVVLLAPDVAEAFPTGRDVNSALRSLMRLQEDLRKPAGDLPAE